MRAHGLQTAFLTICHRSMLHMERLFDLVSQMQIGNCSNSARRLAPTFTLAHLFCIAKSFPCRDPCFDGFAPHISPQVLSIAARADTEIALLSLWNSRASKAQQPASSGANKHILAHFLPNHYMACD